MLIEGENGVVEKELPELDQDGKRAGTEGDDGRNEYIQGKYDECQYRKQCAR